MTLRHVPRFARTEASRSDDLHSREHEAEKLERTPFRRAAAKRFREVELTTWLSENHGLEPGHARSMAKRLLSSTPRIRGAFQKWWLTGRVEDLEVGGYSLRTLIREREMSVFGALLALSLLETRGDEARERLAREPAGDLDPAAALELAED